LLGRSKPFKYRLRIIWPGGAQETEDPYSFPTIIGDLDAWLLAEGSHLRPFERLGAHLREIDGVKGVTFAVWAPDAQRVSVIGDFNTWDGRRHPMRLRRECGVWELFIPRLEAGACYKYEIRARDGRVLPHKADPYGFAAELRPSTASIVHGLPSTSVSRTLNSCRFPSIRSTAPGVTSRSASTRQRRVSARRTVFAISSPPATGPAWRSSSIGCPPISRPTSTDSAASTGNVCTSTPTRAKACTRTGAR
jgi:hypothetical protein